MVLEKGEALLLIEVDGWVGRRVIVVMGANGSKSKILEFLGETLGVVVTEGEAKSANELFLDDDR